MKIFFLSFIIISFLFSFHFVNSKYEPHSKSSNFDEISSKPEIDDDDLDSIYLDEPQSYEDQVEHYILTKDIIKNQEKLDTREQKDSQNNIKIEPQNQNLKNQSVINQFAYGLPKFHSFQLYYYEYTILFIVGFIFLIAELGYNINEKIAKASIKELKNILCPEFNAVGHPLCTSTSALLVNSSQVVLWCTDPRTPEFARIKGIFIELQMVARYSILEMLVSLLRGTLQDKLKITVFFEDDVECSVFVVGNKKILTKDNIIRALMNICKERPLRSQESAKKFNISKDFIFMSELNQLFDSFINNFSEFFMKYTCFIDYFIHSNLTYDDDKSELVMKLEEEKDEQPDNNQDNNNSNKTDGLGSNISILKINLFESFTYSPNYSRLDFCSIFCQFIQLIKIYSHNKSLNNPFKLTSQSKQKLEKIRAPLLVKAKKLLLEKRDQENMKKKDEKMKNLKDRMYQETDPKMQLKLKNQITQKEQRDKQRKQKKIVTVVK